MNNKNKNTQIKNIEASPEVKAYVYQKLSDFSPYLNETSQTGVVIQRVVDDNGQESFQTILSLKTDGGVISTVGLSEDIYGAIHSATDDMMAKISAIHNAIQSNRERDLEIHQARQKQYLH